MKKVILLLAPGFEEVEAVTPIDFLRRADIEVIVLGLGGLEITGSHHITIKADLALEDFHDTSADAILVPGGLPGSANIAASKEAGDLLRAFAESRKLVAALCAAPAYVLEPLGLLKGKRFTAFPGTEDRVKSGILNKERVVVDGNLITACAAGAAAEFSAAIIEYLKGKEAARSVMQKTIQPNEPF